MNYIKKKKKKKTAYHHWPDKVWSSPPPPKKKKKIEMIWEILNTKLSHTKWDLQIKYRRVFVGQDCNSRPIRGQSNWLILFFSGIGLRSDSNPIVVQSYPQWSHSEAGLALIVMSQSKQKQISTAAAICEWFSIWVVLLSNINDVLDIVHLSIVKDAASIFQVLNLVKVTNF